MYIRLGQRESARYRDIVGIFDMDNSTASYITRNTLAKCEEEKKVIIATNDLPKSFTVCVEKEKIVQKRAHTKDKNKNTKIYISQVSSATLLKRAELGLFDE